MSKGQEDHFNKMCKEIEELEKKCPQKMHEKVKQMTSKKKKSVCSASGCIEAKDGTIIMETADILERWQEYIGDLFDDNREKPVIRK